MLATRGRRQNEDQGYPKRAEVLRKAEAEKGKEWMLNNLGMNSSDKATYSRAIKQERKEENLYETQKSISEFAPAIIIPGSILAASLTGYELSNTSESVLLMLFITGGFAFVGGIIGNAVNYYATRKFK